MCRWWLTGIFHSFQYKALLLRDRLKSNWRLTQATLEFESSAIIFLLQFIQALVLKIVFEDIGISIFSSIILFLEHFCVYRKQGLFTCVQLFTLMGFHMILIILCLSLQSDFLNINTSLKAFVQNCFPKEFPCLLLLGPVKLFFFFFLFFFLVATL